LPTSLEELEDLLRRAGLTRYEARAYIALLQLGKGRPLEVSRASGVPRQRIYDVLASLAGKGLAAREGQAYVPVHPREALEALASIRLAEAKLEAERLRRIASSIDWEPPGPRPESTTRVVQGVAASIAEAVRVIVECDEPPVFVAYKVLDKLDEFWPVIEVLVKTLPGGSTVYVPSDAAIPEEKARLLEERGITLRRTPCAYLDAMIACDTIIIGVPSTRHGAETLVIQNPILASAIRERLTRLPGSPDRTSREV